jgi:hypothetical protein
MACHAALIIVIPLMQTGFIVGVTVPLPRAAELLPTDREEKPAIGPGTKLLDIAALPPEPAAMRAAF